MRQILRELLRYERLGYWDSCELTGKLLQSDILKYILFSKQIRDLRLTWPGQKSGLVAVPV